MWGDLERLHHRADGQSRVATPYQGRSRSTGEHSLILGTSLEVKYSDRIINFLLSGSGVLRKGQHSWNISVTKESRINPNVVLELSMECLFGEILFLL